MTPLPLLLLAAAGLAAPKPLANPGTWMTPEDYPPAAVRSSSSGLVYFRLTVSPEGNPIACQITATSRNAELDRLSCTLLMRRARFHPAHDAMGAAMTSSFASSVTWQSEPEFAWISPPDMTLLVSAMPKGFRAKDQADSLILVDPAGTIADCEAGKSDHEVSPGLGKAICQRVTQDWHPKILRDAAGVAVSSIQTVSTGFEISSTP